MSFNALVMSRSASAAKTLVTALTELGVECSVSTCASEIMEVAAAGCPSALVLDFELPQALEVAKMARALAPKRRPVVFGMLGSQTSIAGAFQAGANFVLYKPLDVAQVLHSFRAAQGFMREDRRHRPRQKSEILAYLDYPSRTVPALVLDITEQGISLQAAEPLMPLRGVRLRLLLPGLDRFITGIGDFIWTDERGRAGLFFSDLAPAARRSLTGWLRRRGSKRSQAVRSLLEPQLARAAAPNAH